MLTLREMIAKVGHRDAEAAAALDQAIISGTFSECDDECLERCWKLLTCGQTVPPILSGALLRVLTRFSADAFEKRLLDGWETIDEASRKNVLNHVSTPKLLSTRLVRRLYEINETLSVRQHILVGILKTYRERQCRDELEFMMATIGRHDDPNRQAVLSRLIAEGKAHLQRPAEQKPWWRVW
ncbi:MAG: hypothetical protein NTW19_02910 [Planctomycetota bacterium]|nr:hypothetical protein [Planctomycetota bacterium]